MWIVFTRRFLWCPKEYNRHVAVMFEKNHKIFATREASLLAIERGAARVATEKEIEDARRGT